MARLFSKQFWLGPMPWAGAAVLLAIGGFWHLSKESPPTGDPRPTGGAAELAALRQRDDVNVLFILIDTLRADRLQSYGYSRPTSPVIDALASRGVRFTRHLAQSSWTKCSMASLWTGLYPQRAGVTRFDDVLSQEARLPAEILREAGFRTAGIWRNGWVEGYFGFDQGFEVYSRPGLSAPVPAEVRRENPTESFGGTDLDVVAAADEFLRVNGHERWFLYLHWMDVHEYTYNENTAKFGTSYSDIYDNAILYTNAVLDELLGKLMAGGHLDDTILVITSDHGEAFGERGFEGHARNVYPETTEVPLVISFPFRIERGAQVRQRTANVDVWPTLLDLLGLPPLEPADGRSRVPEILAAMGSQARPEDDTVAIAHLDQTWGQRVHTESPTVAISQGGLRYVQFRNAKGTVNREELYDLKLDPKEGENLIQKQPESAERMRQLAASYLSSEPPWSQEPDLQLNEMQLNQLRALGYSVP